MGRIDADARSSQQRGVEFQEFHQTPAAETIDDAPPPLEEDLYEPPHDYQPHFAARSTPPAPPQPQPFPPPQDHYHHPAAAVHSFPPPPPHQDSEKPPPPPQPFPPPHGDPDKPLPLVGQLFPSLQQQTPQPFPSNIPTPNQYILHPQQQNVPIQFPAQQNLHPGVVGGIPMRPSPLINQQNHLPTQPWKSSLFDCMRNPQNAIITLFFPCVTFGQIAEILDSGSTSCGTSGMLYSLIACCIAMPCIMSCTYRSKLRSKFGLVESPAPDWAVHCFCEYCALCQEYRELQERGFDPSIGWLGNVAQQQKQQQFGMTAPMQQRML